MQIDELGRHIEELGRDILAGIRRAADSSEMRAVYGLTDSGDASFNVDLMAERIVMAWLDRIPEPIAAYTEDLGFIPSKGEAEFVIVVDALDGSRAFKAGLETACVSIGVARFRGEKETCFRDLVLGYLWETKSDVAFAARAGCGTTIRNSWKELAPLPCLATELMDMAWAFDVCGRPTEELFYIIGDLINGSAVRGGVFLLNSTTYAISRILLGRFDAYIDVGVRVVEELPSSTERMFAAGQKQVLGLFPYDIAATYLIAKEAGITMTDAYGRSFDERRLLGSGPETRLSCIAARNSLLHKRIMSYIDERFVDLLSRSERG
ncbi:MAG: hypothetical protein JW941_08110 [Candidatus Coatesbacteria bacterium]|nr:hypothetical protein [Candidatus Coatesbacteria bacterium]